MITTLQRAPGIEWTAVSRALPGESVSGDQHVVASSTAGVLIAVIDGLGHGDEATRAARLAAETLATRASEPILALVQHCHRALRDTRGAAMTILALDAGRRIAQVVGIGNVETVLVRAERTGNPARETALLRGGVVGYRLPVLQTSEWRVAAGDVVVFATDGVREDFGDRITATEPLPQLVERILAQSYRGTDDALVLACKILDDHES